MTTRQQIISLLQTKNQLSAQEMSRALQLTPANIRHHLSILEEEGVVEVASQQKMHGKGRPIQIYMLSRQVISNNLDGLARALLDELFQNHEQKQIDILMSGIASRLAIPDKIADQSLSKRFFRTIQRLNEMHYQAHWEARPDAPRIYLEHCPYATILSEHPELCQIDKCLLEKLLDHPVTQTVKLEKDMHGNLYCLFIAKRDSEPMVK